MAVIYAVGGVPGAGKTTFVDKHDDLRDLERLDIADYYERHYDETRKRLHHTAALNMLLDDVNNWLKANLYYAGQHLELVVEATFFRNSQQRKLLLELAETFVIPVEVRFIYCTPGEAGDGPARRRRDCIWRIKNDPNQSSRRQRSRINITYAVYNSKNRKSLGPRAFLPIEGEEPDSFQYSEP